MHDRTHKKLREAGFFLFKASEAAQSRILRPEPEAVEFYISAFVSAGRSVTFALAKDEGGPVDDWTIEWIKRLEPIDQKLMSFFNAQRVGTIHRGEMDTSHNVTSASVQDFYKEYSQGEGEIAYGRSFVISPPGTPQPTFEAVEMKFEGLPGGSAIDYCCRYLDLLQQLVADFESGHPQAPSAMRTQGSD